MPRMQLESALFQSSSLYVISSLLKRNNVASCSACGWSHGTCDLHHIEGRNIEDPHNTSNLAFLCPNCHRLFHEGKLQRSEFMSVYELLEDIYERGID